MRGAMLAPSLVVLPETPGHEVRERDEVVLRHVLGHMLQRPGREAAAPGGREVEAERHGDEERGEADHHDDELLAEEGGQEAAAQEAAEEAVILSLRGLGAALPDWVVVVVVALVAHGRGLGGAVAVSS